ncbi:MAG TPA: histidine kinase, partial [Bacteroidia bacterium]
SILASCKSQMNPHFFYNALNTIQAYIFVNDKKKASNYLSKFSKLTRLILEMSERENISLREELEALKLYLDLEKMRFSDSFEYEIKVSSDIVQDSVEFPPMLLQPYVENAVKHGLLHKQGEKSINIKFARKEDILIVEIEDNGIGRKRSAELNAIKNKKHQSFSTQANEKRLEILNEGRKAKIAVEYVDKLSNEGNPLGTLVRLYIPI